MGLGVVFTFLFLLVCLGFGRFALNREDCKQKRKIILDVNKSGLGNRLLGLTSAAMLAVLLDRSLFLNWKNKPNCQAKFTDLFITDGNPQIHGAFFPVNTTEDIVPDAHEYLDHYECHIVLENRDNFDHFHLLYDHWLFAKLDKECDVIHIQTNQYFAPLLFTLGVRGRKLEKMFTSSPFNFFARCVYHLHQHIVSGANELLTKLEGSPWLSIHVRY